MRIRLKNKAYSVFQDHKSSRFCKWQRWWGNSRLRLANKAGLIVSTNLMSPYQMCRTQQDYPPDYPMRKKQLPTWTKLK